MRGVNSNLKLIQISISSGYLCNKVGWVTFTTESAQWLILFSVIPLRTTLVFVPFVHTFGSVLGGLGATVSLVWLYKDEFWGLILWNAFCLGDSPPSPFALRWVLTTVPGKVLRPTDSSTFFKGTFVLMQRPSQQQLIPDLLHPS